MRVRQFQRFMADEAGATAVEYGLLCMFIAVALLSSFTLLGNALTNLFGSGAGSAATVIGAAAAKLN